MTASWPEMPAYGDPGYDRSDWLADTDPVELVREHRELLRIAQSYGIGRVGIGRTEQQMPEAGTDGQGRARSAIRHRRTPDRHEHPRR